MSAGNFKLKAQKYLAFGLRPHDSLGPSGLGSPADGKRRIVAPIVLCVGGVPKQSKTAIEAEVENNFVYYLNSKCCRVPLSYKVTIIILLPYLVIVCLRITLPGNTAANVVSGWVLAKLRPRTDSIFPLKVVENRKTNPERC